MDPTLVDKITREVLAALGTAARRTSPEPAPPGSAGLAETDEPARLEPRAAGPVGRIFITAEMLAERLTGGSSTLALAANERLTPAAIDLAERKHVTVIHSARNAAPTVGKTPQAESAIATSGRPPICTAPASGPGPVQLVVERPTQKVRGVLSALAHDGIRFLGVAGSDCWIENLRTLCRDVAAGRAALGVAMLPYAADAMVVANKVKGARAVQGTRPESVAGAIRHVGANVLILEHELSTFHQLRQMTRIFIRDRMICGAAAAAMKAIEQLEGTN